MSVFNNVIFKDFNLTPRAKKAYKDAYELSKDMGHNNINNLHVAYGCAIRHRLNRFVAWLFWTP